jgi:hypothetical protein
MNICIIALIVTGGFLAGATSSSQAQSSPAPAAKPAPIIITNAPVGGKGAKPYLSAGVPEILRMHEAGVDKSVLLAFVQSSSVAYHPSAREVIYLRDEGLSPEIISAMLKRGGELRDRAADLQREELRTRQVEQPAPAAPAPAPAEPAQPQPSTTVVPQTTQVVYDSTPVYTYPARNYISFPYYGYGYVRPSWYGYSYANCGSYYGPSFGFGYRSACYPRLGFSVGFGGYRGGWHGGGGWRHCR